MASTQRGLARTTRRGRREERREMVDEDPKVPGENGGWDIDETLKHSLGRFPLQLGAPVDHFLAELRPQIEEEVRSVARLERRRHLSNREHRQAGALRDLLAVIKNESLNVERGP